MKFKSHFSLFTALLMIATVACSDEEPEVEPAPERPPESTMNMEFESFGNDNGRTEGKVNATAAVSVIATWQLKSLALLIPRAAYAASFQQTPTFADGTWTWTYNVDAQNLTYNISLTGTPGTDGISWKMYVSNGADLDEFLWFEGVSAYGGLSGTWTLYDPSDHVALLHITWSRNENGTLGEIRYTNTAGEYIEYGIVDDANFDAFYNINGVDGTVEIVWHREKKNGRITIDGEAHCWDTTYEDVDC